MEAEKEFIIKKSRFIASAFPISGEAEVFACINGVKAKYKKAAHYCYAYVVNGQEKCSDDGEPGGTAGKPILSVIKKRGLNNTLVVVTRYFGGIKLGAGPLLGAYVKAASLALTK